MAHRGWPILYGTAAVLREDFHAMSDRTRAIADELHKANIHSLHDIASMLFSARGYERAMNILQGGEAARDAKAFIDYSVCGAQLQVVWKASDEDEHGQAYACTVVSIDDAGILTVRCNEDQHTYIVDPALDDIIFTARHGIASIITIDGTTYEGYYTAKGQAHGAITIRKPNMMPAHAVYAYGRRINPDD